MALIHNRDQPTPQNIEYHGTAVTDAASLGREAERAKGISFEEVDAGLIARVLDREERIEVVDLEHTLDAPKACRGAATIWEPADFISYVNRLASDATTLWANPTQGQITAVFDDHTDHEKPGWRRHTATLQCLPDPEWSAWVERNGKLGTQEVFAEHIEDHMLAVVQPDPATMLELATSFQARRNASFERGTRLQSGDVQLRFVEQTTASAGTKGQIEVPERFTIRVAVYLGTAPVELDARLRWRIHDGQLRIGYALHRPDIAQREAFDRIRALVAQGCSADLHLGATPPQLHPARVAAF